MTGALAFLVPAAAAAPLRYGPRKLAAPLLMMVALFDLILSLFIAIETPVIDAPVYLLQRYFVLDPTSVVFLVVVNSVFLGISVYMYTKARASEVLAQQLPQMASLSVVFMAAMNMGVLSNHLLMMWAFIEATTLAAAPMVARGESPRARRVAWQYLLYSSVSLAITFIGFMCLARSAQLRGAELSFAIDQLPLSLAQHGDTWQRLGLGLMLFGLGSKLGLAPVYGWLPQTYDEAPPSVSALLAAVQFNVSVVAVFRVLQVFRTDDADFVSHELMAMGCLSLVVAAVQIMATRNYKRLIAYACVSSAGVIAIGLAVGRAAAYGVVLYVVSAAFVKAILFLTAGHLKTAYGTKDVGALSGIIKELPFAGILFTVGTFALLGFPPFGSFMAEMLILSGIVQSGHFMVFALLCTMLTFIFVAAGRSLFPMLWGEQKHHGKLPTESYLAAVPKMAFVVVLVSLGVYTPEPVARLLRLVATSIGGQ